MCILTCIYTDEINTSSLESVGEEQQKVMRIQARSSQETMNLVGKQVVNSVHLCIILQLKPLSSSLSAVTR